MIYVFKQSGLPGQAVAYFDGEHPGYFMEECKEIKNWITPSFNIGSFDETTGKRLTIEGILTDFLNNDINWVVVSDKLKKLLSKIEYLKAKIQFLPVKINLNTKDKKNITYWILNVLESKTDIIDEVKSKKVAGSYLKIVIKKDFKDLNGIFRISGYESAIFISEDIKVMLELNKITGVEWVECNF